MFSLPARPTCLLLAVLAALAGPTNATAQIVRGRLVGLQGSEGVGGAMMTLVDGEDRRLASTLTRASGLFELESPAAGRYRVKAERIGYATTWSDPFDIAAGDTLTIRIDVVVQAISLALLGPRCRRAALRPLPRHALFPAAPRRRPR
ncbi:MAG: carboxypeptidase-like regulatory domain-containing protein, partial [Gemmatimonadetes bacterium]|nr:carboxypeptidase-like regulatory domain-containing protein [Gemmatimonadota bacterium]